eukprot:5706348-Pyramimonas_sp.AAC.1
MLPQSLHGTAFTTSLTQHSSHGKAFTSAVHYLTVWGPRWLASSKTEITHKTHRVLELRADLVDRN